MEARREKADTNPDIKKKKQHFYNESVMVYLEGPLASLA